jgi:hypothetical protein
MSRTAVNEVLDRALLDEQFRDAVQTDPDNALADYELTDDERTSLLSRKMREIQHIGAQLIVTARFVITNEQLIAFRPKLDDARKAELAREGERIVAMSGDRTQAIRELLVQMR